MRRTVSGAVLALAIVALTAIAPVTSPSNDARLVAIMRQAITGLSTDFRAEQSQVATVHPAEIDYKPSSAFAKLCPDCIITDEFATASIDEHRGIKFHWTTAQVYTAKQLDAYIVRMFSPLVSGSRMIRSGSGIGWEISATQDLFVFPDADSRGFRVVVVHYLAKNIHIIRFARGFTSSDRDELAKAVRNFVTLAAANASTNFVSLGKGGSDALNVSFGELLEDCRTESVIRTNPTSDNRSYWMIGCATVTVGGPKADSESALYDAVVAALPSGFRLSTDPAQRPDYSRWDRASDDTMIYIRANAYDETGATNSFDLEVDHFVPLP